MKLRNKQFWILMAMLFVTISSFSQKLIMHRALEPPSQAPLWVVDGVVLAVADSVFNIGLDILESDSAATVVHRVIPLIESKDIEFIKVIRPEDSLFIYGYRASKGVVVITTFEESGVSDFLLDGVYVVRKKRIKLGLLLDYELLKRGVKKQWRINPKKIESIELFIPKTAADFLSSYSSALIVR